MRGVPGSRSMQWSYTLRFSFSKYPELFSGGLGKATGIKPIQLELKSYATPDHIKRAFTIPQYVIWKPLKRSIDHVISVS
jgi:hypothetical protein